MSVWARTPPEAPAPPDGGPAFADLYDGAEGLRRRVRLEDAGDLLLHPPEGAPARWPRADIRRLRDQPEGALATFALARGRARLVTTDPQAQALVAGIARDPGGPRAGPRLWPRAAATVAACAAALAALVLLVLPALAGLLAARMSPDAEVALGDTHWEQVLALFGGPRECDAPAGRAALDALVARVADPLDLPYALDVAVLDDRRNPTLNAFAVAGGRVAFFDTMIQAAETPEEIAAVLAHELGHVTARDPVRGLLQSASGVAVLSVLAGDLTGGGLIGATAGGALSASYSRGAEARADRFAADLLAETGLPRAALGRMFERLRDAHGTAEGLLAHFATHPDIAARIEALADLPDPGGPPALTAAQWADLRAICG